MIEKVTVAIVTYRQFDTVYSAISSVLGQSYGNIELIVSDDGSDNFPDEKIRRFIEENKSGNISNYIVRTNEKNLGTVAHLNRVVEAAGGAFVAVLAGDDELYDDKTIEKYVEAFERAGESYKIQMAQTAMCDFNLDKTFGYYLLPHIQHILETGDREGELLGELAYAAYLPSTSTIYRKSFFDEYGGFDESYKLIEDIPLHVRLAAEHIPILYSNFPAIKHRSGGISHGAVNALSNTKIMYINDTIRYWEKCVIPRLSEIPEEQAQPVKQRANGEIRQLKKTLHSSERKTECFNALECILMLLLLLSFKIIWPQVDPMLSPFLFAAALALLAVRVVHDAVGAVGAYIDRQAETPETVYIRESDTL